MQDISAWEKLWNQLIYGWDLSQLGETLFIVPDFSHWSVDSTNPTIDEDKFAKQIEDKGVTAIIYKGTDSWNGNLFTDKTASFWWGIGEKFGLARGAYHWLQPGVDPTVAFKYHRNHLREYPTEFPYIMDFEEPKIVSATDYLWRAQVWLELANADRNDDALVYSAPWYIGFLKGMIGSNLWEQKIGWLRNWPLWCAYYSRYYPKGLWPWNDFVGWQYSSAADFPYYKDDDLYWGNEWGIPSQGLDMSYFRVEWLNKYVGTIPEPPPDPEEPEPTEGLVYYSNNDMNIRSGPSTSYTISGLLKANTRVVANDVGGYNSWILTDKGWICNNLNGKQYLIKEG